MPRLLDMGQCNNAYGAIKVAVGLAEAFGCTVNDLPLTLLVSWFEQKAVAVLLTLLALGVKGITIGPKPPAFVSPGSIQDPPGHVRSAAYRVQCEGISGRRFGVTVGGRGEQHPAVTGGS